MSENTDTQEIEDSLVELTDADYKELLSRVQVRRSELVAQENEPKISALRGFIEEVQRKRDKVRASIQVADNGWERERLHAEYDRLAEEADAYEAQITVLSTAS